MRPASSRRPAPRAPEADEDLASGRDLEPGVPDGGALESSRFPFPDSETPARRGDPWDQTTGTEADGLSSGLDRERTLGDWLEAVIPADAQVHFIRAGQEFAAGVQTTVDHHLGRGSGASARGDGASRIEIE